ncbi:MAG TPA: YdeI/OmpD-associated family protein [Mycobacteriales bacterium]|nr:YdeI/OmpD-associated family protein [Mycobacteriales bacterium]
MRFRATLELGGKTATGIEVPASVVEALGAGRRVPVSVTLQEHTYRTTIAPMGGRFLVPVSAEVRRAAGVAAGDELDVGIEVDTAPRTVEVPADLAAALAAEPSAQAAWAKLAFTHQKEWVRSVEDAKKPETRQRRIAAALDRLR